MRIRNKVTEKEAMRLTRSTSDVVVSWIGKENLGDFNLGEFAEDACYLEIKTLEGVMTANERDYVIKGLNGEFYPCKPDIFEKSYEIIEETK